MKTLIFISLYLLGAVLNYLLARHCHKGVFKEYTIRDRRFYLLMSILSFAGVLAALLTIFPVYLSETGKDLDKPAKW